MSIAVVVVGSAVVDLTFRLQNLPAGGESQIAHSRATFAGGKGANQAVAAARFGAETAFVGAVGRDDFGRLLEGSLVDAGVDVTGLLSLDGENTGMAAIGVDARGQNMIMVSLGVNDTLTRAQIESAVDTSWRPKVVSSVLEVPDEAIAAGLEWGRSQGAVTVLNAAPPRAVSSHLWALVDVLVVNEHECRDLSGIDPASPMLQDQALDALQALGPQSIVLTLGDQGAVVRQGSHTVRLSAPAVQAVDTVGAGDCFVGVLCALLAEGQDVVEASATACRAASLSVTRAGAQASMPRRSDIALLV